MSNTIKYILSKINIENFSLLKEKKKKIFGYYKTASNKYYCNNKNNFCSIVMPRTDIQISKEINLNFVETVNMKFFNEIINTSFYENNLNINNSISIFEDMNKQTKNKIRCKEDVVINRFCKKSKVKKSKNALIKPIMFEDSFNFNNNDIVHSESQKDDFNKNINNNNHSEIQKNIFINNKDCVNNNNIFNYNYNYNNNFLLNFKEDFLLDVSELLNNPY